MALLHERLRRFTGAPAATLWEFADDVNSLRTGTACAAVPARQVGSARSVLKAQVIAVEPQLLECVERAVKAGQQPTGRASLTFIIAPADGRIIVETTGIDHDETTLEDGPLLECLRETARAMTFDALPTGGDALSVHREVVLDKGVLVDHRVTEYSVLRDTDPLLP